MPKHAVEERDVDSLMQLKQAKVQCDTGEKSSPLRRVSVARAFPILNREFNRNKDMMNLTGLKQCENA